MKSIIAFTDGSFNKKINLCGSGIAFLNSIDDDAPIEQLLFGTSDYGYTNMRNVGGEIRAAEEAIKYAIDNKYEAIDIYYDYFGIEMWATKKWKTNNQYTSKYASFCDTALSKIKITFHHIKGHSNNKWNDYVDLLAKRACKI